MYYQLQRGIAFLMDTNFKEGSEVEIEGIVESVRFKNMTNGYTVIDIDQGSDIICAVGKMPTVHEGEYIKIKGAVKNNPTYGEQIEVSEYEQSEPNNADTALRFLSSGVVKGIGKSAALRIVDKFGENTMEVIENEPQRLTEIKGITKSKAESIHDQVSKTFEYNRLYMFLRKYSITSDECVTIWKALGNNAKQKIIEDPFILCSEELNINFEAVDNLVQSNKYEYDEASRIGAAMTFILSHNLNNGHTCLPINKLVLTCADYLECSQDDVRDALDIMIEQGNLFLGINYESDEEYVFLPSYYNAESYTADRLGLLLQYPPEPVKDIESKIQIIEKTNNITYAPIQKEAITDALTKGALILTGGPGTGKTTTLKAIITILMENKCKVLLGAPTGRAAKRMEELTGCEAKTIHRLLEVEWSYTEKPIFRRNERNPFNCNALILDEVSMIDTLLFESVVRALPLGCRLILVGDSDQLPSVGAGNVLADLKNSGVLPTVTLDTVFRQSMQSLIITNAHRINSGEMPIMNDKNNDFFFLPDNDVNSIKNTVLSLYSKRLPKAYGYSPIKDIQVISFSRVGELGTNELNASLQEVINPASDNKNQITINTKVFREGDKVMQCKNNYKIAWTRDDGVIGEGIFNGDIGILQEIKKSSKSVKIRFDDRTATYNYDSLHDIELAYCMTVHKSQGNEFEAVIIPVHTPPTPLIYRNLLYTAVTRAKKLIIFVGKAETVYKMIANYKKKIRYSNFQSFLSEYSDQG